MSGKSLKYQTLHPRFTRVTKLLLSFTVPLCLSLEAAPALTPPAAPWGMLASSPWGNQVILSWTDRPTNETGFKLERKGHGPGAPFVEIADLKTNAYVDTTVPPGAVYT